MTLTLINKHVSTAANTQRYKAVFFAAESSASVFRSDR